MTDTIGKREMGKMFAQAAEQIEREHANLSALDSVAGDGDHGTTMLRIAEQLKTAAKADPQSDLRTLLHQAGWNVLGVDGGASSALLGTFFVGMADAEIGHDSMTCVEVANAFEAGLRAVSRQTKARQGDKTLMDALLPAVRAISAAAASQKTAATAFEEAAAAARTGADSTKNMVARFGRAKFLGEKTLGHPDAGATSVALLFAGFSTALVTERTD